jgi:hypothetical protein
LLLPCPTEAKHGQGIHACIHSTSQHGISITPLYQPAKHQLWKKSSASDKHKKQ